ncbi:hypothetical protein GH714_014440 [Hevea brasiliensis]|uniref:RING-type domain-containing protein n=1 Tax=Hevea brasiliensis TaxID=3981 RepID=A0A6A6KR56_HEVBR|nr:hypothetical protein GH714_014440 [Hevea brasiliensis]
MGRLSGSQESSPALRLPLLVLMGNDEDALAMAELATDEDGPNTQPASAQLFEKLEVIRIEESGLVCSIWLGQLSIESEARRLPCSRVYHGNCIMERLKKTDSNELVCSCEHLKRKVVPVRVNALFCFGVLVHTLDKYAVLEILQTIQCCTAVDCPAPTLMCAPEVANSIFKLYGVEFVAEHVLPLLVLLLTFQQLNVPQFAKYMLFVKDILRTSLISAVPGQQTTASCPPVDIEWPPQASSGVTPQLRDADKQLNTGASSSSSFDDLDPFANWPPT